MRRNGHGEGKNWARQPIWGDRTCVGFDRPVSVALASLTWIWAARNRLVRVQDRKYKRGFTRAKSPAVRPARLKCLDRFRPIFKASRQRRKWKHRRPCAVPSGSTTRSRGLTARKGGLYLRHSAGGKVTPAVHKGAQSGGLDMFGGSPSANWKPCRIASLTTS